MDPMAMGAPPMDPAAMGAPPPDMGGMQQPMIVDGAQLVELFQQIASEMGPNEAMSVPTKTNEEIGQRLDSVEGKLDEIGGLLAQVMGGAAPMPPDPGMGAAGIPAGPEAMPPDLAAAMAGGGMPPEAMPPAAGLGAGMPPPPGGAPVPMMPQASVGGNGDGMTKSARAVSASRLAMRLRAKK
jgi:hypothetical protein